MIAPARYRADWLVPVAAPPIADGALLVDAHGRIAAVGPHAEVPCPDDALRVELGRAALMPGLVNVHAHPELSALRGALEDLPFDHWIQRLRRLKRDTALTAEELRTCARWQLLEAYAAGITTIGATEDSDATFVALLETGGRGVVYRETFAPAPEQTARALATLQDHVRQMRVRETELVRVGVSPHAPYTVCDDHFVAVARYALAEGLPLAVHIAESASEVELVTRAAGTFAAGLRRRGIDVAVRAASPIALLEQLGVLAARPMLIHCVHVDAADVARIALHGASVAHCPVANARLGHGIAPVADMLAAGITVALGSDSVASNNRMDLLEEARVAQLMQRALRHVATELDAATLVRMATIEGARALGLERQTGTLEVGKDADLCAVALDAPHTRPAPDPLVALVHAARAADVMLTVVRGRVLYRNGTHHTLERAAVQEAFEPITTRVAAINAQLA